MKRILGRKQSMKAEDEEKWWEVINNIERYISQAEVEDAAAEAIDRIKRITEMKNTAYMWSGGKDSLVIAHLCYRAGITKSYCLVTGLEYPQWLDFLQENKPPDCEIINVGYDLDFVEKRPELLFPKGEIAQYWNKNVRQKNFRKLIQNKKIDVLILGHRTMDGNICGNNGIRRPNYGGILYSPIYDWTHEMLFGYMSYQRIELPFIYRWRRGFYFGTHLWTEQDSFDEVYEIDPSVVTAAAEKIEKARKWLEGLRCDKY